MLNNKMLCRIQNVVMYKKFDFFYSKYCDTFDKVDIRENFFIEFNIRDAVSEEYVLFLEYLINKRKWV